MKKILVVDNHPVMLELMRNLLEKQGHQGRKYRTDKGIEVS